jgi:hypothetical protein
LRFVKLNVFIVLVLVFDIILNGFFISIPTDGTDIETARPQRNGRLNDRLIKAPQDSKKDNYYRKRAISNNLNDNGHEKPPLSKKQLSWEGALLRFTTD